jgi:large subunit ribosomal protein L21
MFAIVETGSKQYRVKEGDIIKIEKIDGNIGDRVKLDRVLAFEKEGGILLGEPELKEAYIDAEIVDQYRDKTVLVYKKRRRKDSKKRYGQRQYITEVKIGRLLEG